MSEIKTKPTSKAYREGFDNINWKKSVNVRDVIQGLPKERQQKINQRAEELLRELQK